MRMTKRMLSGILALLLLISLLPAAAEETGGAADYGYPWLDKTLEETRKYTDVLFAMAQTWQSVDDIPFNLDTFPIQPTLDLTKDDAVTALNLPKPNYQEDMGRVYWSWSLDDGGFAYVDEYEVGIRYMCVETSLSDGVRTNAVSFWECGAGDLFYIEYSQNRCIIVLHNRALDTLLQLQFSTTSRRCYHFEFINL